MEDLFRENPAVALAVGGLVILIFVAVGVVAIKERSTLRAQKSAQLASRELAVITEDIRMTGWGGLSVVLLVLTALWSFVSYGLATTVFQQIQAGVSLIGGLILFGLGAALGRRRTYTVLRSQHRTD